MAQKVVVSASTSHSSLINSSAFTEEIIHELHEEPRASPKKRTTAQGQSPNVNGRDVKMEDGVSSEVSTSAKGQSPKVKGRDVKRVEHNEVSTSAKGQSPKVKGRDIKRVEDGTSMNGTTSGLLNGVPTSDGSMSVCTEEECSIAVANGLGAHGQTNTPTSDTPRENTGEGAREAGGGAVVKIHVPHASPSKYAPPPKLSPGGHTRTNSAGGVARGPAASGHVRGGSASDSSSRSEVGSPSSDLSQERPAASSSSSSLSQDASFLSQDISFASRNVLVEHLKAEIFKQRTASDPTLLSSSSHDGSEDGGGASGAPQKDEVITQLLEHIVDLKMEVASLHEQNGKLKAMRSNMDDELHTLTENLFEEAYKMVDEAKGSKVSAEKRLADAAGKIDALETEMTCLKTVLHAPPDKHTLHPPHATSGSPHNRHKKSSVKRALRKISKRTGVPLGRTKHHTPHPLELLEHKHEEKGALLVEGEPDQEDLDVFRQWLKALTSNNDHPYLASIVALDVRPCLAFKNAKLSEQVLNACEQNTLHMETIATGAGAVAVAGAESGGGTGVKGQDKPSAENGSVCSGVCALSGSTGISCTHRIKIADSKDWHYVSQQCRDRIAAVCDFYMFIGHIRKGIIKSDEAKLFWEVSRLRALMSLARLTLRLPDLP